MTEFGSNVGIEFQPKQRQAFELFDTPAQYPGYGGAKGGGKSKLIRDAMMIRRLKYAGTMGLIVRKTFPELMKNHIRKFWQEFPQTKDWYRAGEKAIHFPNGSILDFHHLDATDDVFDYQGIEYDDICLDEATQHEELVFKILKTSLRNDPMIKKRYPDFNPTFLNTFNPGGIGHGWVQRLYIDRNFTSKEYPDDYPFTQAKIWDNPIFVEANPQYLRNLEDLPEYLRKAYLDGDWNIFAGQFFKKLRYEKHVIEPINLTNMWVRFRSLDWGFDHNTVCLWWAVDYEGNAYIYRVYKKNEVAPSRMAKNILEMTPFQEHISQTVASHDLWTRIKTDETAPQTTLADIIMQSGLYVDKAVNSRVQGWQVLMEMLEWDEEKRPTPRLRIFKSCEEVFYDLTRLIHDVNNTEDAKKMSGDDTADALRYGAMYVFESKRPELELTPQEKFIEKITNPAYQEQQIFDWGKY